MGLPDRGRGVVAEGDLLWEPGALGPDETNIGRYQTWLSQRGKAFASYDELWNWSVTDLAGFWASIWDYFEIQASKPYEAVLAQDKMPGAQWFVGAELNYAVHALRFRDEHPALIFRREGQPAVRWTYGDLYKAVSSVAAALKGFGVQRGDRVVGYLPNIPEAVVAFLAAASLGAIWSSCPPEFGVQSVIDRFSQIQPKVMFAVDGYTYAGKKFDRRAELEAIRGQLPTLERTILVPYLDPGSVDSVPGAIPWSALLNQDAGDWAPEAVPFDHPLWILYSSGTTGLPKAIVHSHGGILLEHFKALSLHLDLGRNDRFFWFTTTGWMMWNFLVSGLLLGCTIVLYDGSPAYPDLNVLWKMAEEERITYFGTSAPYILNCLRQGLHPGETFDLSALRGIGSTGAPLPPEGFQWVYEKVHDRLLLGSISGGTDVCTAFVLSCPVLPVHAGEIQCRGLGAKVEAYDEEGRSVVGQVGELVITKPLPSMPVYFWNDPEGRRYQASYFERFPGIWHHGDWIKITERGSCVIYGRSDATLNRAGVRMGTSDFYRVVEALDEVKDSLVIDTSGVDGEGRIILYVSLKEGLSLTEGLKDKIRQELRRRLSPRHTPDEIHQVPAIPRTLNGKKIEVPVKRILQGTPVDKALAAGSLDNPAALEGFLEVVLRSAGAGPRQSPAASGA